MTANLILAATVLAMTAMLCIAATRAWRGWLEFKRLELRRLTESAAGHHGHGEDDVGLRIEFAAVRERLKRLEAIASGVEL